MWHERRSRELRVGEGSGTRNESLQGRHCFFRQRVRPRTQHSDWLKMTAPVIMTQTSSSEAIKYTNTNVGYVLEAFRKLSIESNDVVHLKDEQEKTVDCLLDGGAVLAVMSTE